MKVKDLMTPDARFIPAGSSLREAAKEMKKLDCGFLPIGHADGEKLQGVVTDRDIVLRGVANGLDPDAATVEEVKSDKVLYCFKDDDVDPASRSMQQNQVYRLVVLDNKEDKRMCGIISLGDVIRGGEKEIASKTASVVTEAA